MKQTKIAERIIVEGKEDEAFTGNFEVYLVSGEGGTQPKVLVHSKNTIRGHGCATTATERNNIVVAIETYLEDTENARQ